MSTYRNEFGEDLTSDDLAALVRAAQREAGERIAEEIAAEMVDQDRWPSIAHLRALSRAVAIANGYAGRIEP